MKMRDHNGETIIQSAIKEMKLMLKDPALLPETKDDLIQTIELGEEVLNNDYFTATENRMRKINKALDGDNRVKFYIAVWLYVLYTWKGEHAKRKDIKRFFKLIAKYIKDWE